MNNYIDINDIINVIKDFLYYNEGNEVIENLLISIGAEILNINQDKFLEIIK